MTEYPHNHVTERPIQFKYGEDEILNEIHAYIKKTYGSHYGDQVQVQDLIISSGHAEGFYIGNIIKYASRYGKKNGASKADLMKIVHYTILMINHHNQQNKD